MDVLYIIIAAVAVFLVVYTVFGRGKSSGRGLVVVYGYMRNGKTWYVTRDVLEAMERRRSGKKLYSNYSIVHPRYGPVAKWKEEYKHYAITDSIIVIDEAYRYSNYNAHTWQDFTPEDMEFYATSGQNGNTIYFIIQEFEQLGNILRGLAAEYIELRKTAFGDRVLWFTAYHYAGEKSARKNRKKPVRVERFINWPWSREFDRVYQAYNTEQFRRRAVRPFEPEMWPGPKPVARVGLVRKSISVIRPLLVLAASRALPLFVALRAALFARIAGRSLPATGDGPGLWDVVDVPAPDWLDEFLDVSMIECASPWAGQLAAMSDIDSEPAPEPARSRTSTAVMAAAYVAAVALWRALRSRIHNTPRRYSTVPGVELFEAD